MKKGQIAEGNVTTVEFPNKGIVMTDEGERVIVKNTIPGQRVSFAVNKVRKGKAEGTRPPGGPAASGRPRQAGGGHALNLPPIAPIALFFSSHRAIRPPLA